MFTNNKTAKAVRLALIASAASTAMVAPSAFAIEEDSANKVERISVTGSRIKRADMEGANPVQVITRQDLINSGITNIGDILQEIPSVSGAGTNASINNGGSGAVRVSLRGLGSQRTLVLLNGRRMVASGSGANASVDLSTIPTAIIKRIEVLKDGASAIYGSDAIAGVVNIITRDDFEGFEANTSYDASTHGGDGHTKRVDFTIGFANDKGNAVVNAYYVQQGAQWSGDRDWSKFAYDLNPATGELEKGGSSAPPWGRYNGVNSAFKVQGKDDDGKLVFNKDGTPKMVVDPKLCNSFTHGAANGPGQSDPGSFSNPTGYDCWSWGKDTYNFAPINYHLTPSERYGVFASGSHEITENIRFFSELTFSRRLSDIKLAPLPLAPLAFFGVTNAAYSKDSYYNQQFGPKDKEGNTVDIADWRRRMIETGGRDTKYRIDTVRAVFGVDGEFDNGWGYEVSYIFGSNDSTTSGAGGVNFEKVSKAVGPSFKDIDGKIVCGTAANPIAGCVPLNVFGIPGTDTAITQEMMDYITFEAHDFGSNEQQIVSASIFGEAFDMPAGSVGVAFGIEHREESGADYPDALIALGITSGSSRTSTVGSYEVDEAYFEANIPLLIDAPAAELLEVDIAIRYSDYSTFGDTTNGKLGVRWVPFEGLMLRGTASQAFRAPSTSELFAGSADNSPEVADPCATNPSKHCIADGVPEGGFEPIGDQLSSTRGGNDKLTPEEADILTLGVVYSPESIENLSFTFDYWDIEITNAISTIGEQLILTKCATEGIYCDKITRYTSGPLLGNSSDIDDRNINVGGVESSGYDFNVRYSTDIEVGTLSFNLDTTYYDTYEITQADGSIVKNDGWFLRNSGDGNFPKVKSNFDVSLSNDDWSVNWTTRYISSVKEPFDANADDTVAPGEHRNLGSSVIHDARFTYFMENMTATFGIDNIFDQDPPFADTGFNDNTDPRTYNTQGRHLSLSLGVKF